jgi:hypothetical protein
VLKATSGVDAAAAWSRGAAHAGAVRRTGYPAPHIRTGTAPATLSAPGSRRGGDPLTPRN